MDAAQAVPLMSRLCLDEGQVKAEIDQAKPGAPGGLGAWEVIYTGANLANSFPTPMEGRRSKTAYQWHLYSGVMWYKRPTGAQLADCQMHLKASQMLIGMPTPLCDILSFEVVRGACLA